MDDNHYFQIMADSYTKTKEEETALRRDVDELEVNMEKSQEKDRATKIEIFD